ncbi:copper transport ctr4 [Fusarium napiforme]|uniref:Copper transport protein n=1 Tax=Fusarium napiforme TaxID=42672 RepID=A0A8H5JAJ9_9HYPO|nr:copper transport ctr4 [Fusarium napiforme]
MHPASATTLAASRLEEFESCLRNNMLWNWNTIGTCFISEGWYISSAALFALTCFGAFGVALLFEFIRRVSRELDRHTFARDVGNPNPRNEFPGIELGPLQPVAAQPVDAQPAGPQPADAQPADAQPADARSADAQPVAGRPASSRPASAIGPNNRVPPFFHRRVEHALTRSLLYVLQVAIAYGLILMAVSFNGYVILCIVVGHYLGCVIFGRDPQTETNKPNAYQRVFQQPVICCDV